MLTHVRLQNYRSFSDAEVTLSPLTLVLGANGAGKTNFLKAFRDCSADILSALGQAPGGRFVTVGGTFERHKNHRDGNSLISFALPKGDFICRQPSELIPPDAPENVQIFRLEADVIAAAEKIAANPLVQSTGGGTTQTLESLKNGDHEAQFDAAEAALRAYVPEIEKLSFHTVEAGTKQMQVRERGLKEPMPAPMLSEGTRLIIALLAIIYQPVKPPVILLEDIDRGMHPRLFEQMVELMQRIARDQDVQIIATTHNPYLVDCFRENPEAVVIVEKKDGVSTLSTLAQKLEHLDYNNDDPTEIPLGNLWFSGLVGGVPDFLQPRSE